jgi:hypothetical protein
VRETLSPAHGDIIGGPEAADPLAARRPPDRLMQCRIGNARPSAPNRFTMSVVVVRLLYDATRGTVGWGRLLDGMPAKTQPYRVAGRRAFSFTQAALSGLRIKPRCLIGRCFPISADFLHFPKAGERLF